MANQVEVINSGFSASASFTPAAASHLAGDVNGGLQELLVSSNRTEIVGDVMVTAAEFLIAGGTAEASAWTLHLYNAIPASPLADDSPWDLVAGDRTAYQGKVDLGTAVDVGATNFIETQGINKQITLAGAGLFGYLVNGTTVTPAAVAHTAKLRIVRL